MNEVRTAVYFEVLADLDGERVEAAISALLKEDRSDLPPPGVLRKRAESVAQAEVSRAVPSAFERPTAAPEGTPQERSADDLEREGRRPWLGVLFGILGLFPLALWFGFKSLADRRRAQAAGRRYQGEFWAAVTAIVTGAIAGIAAVFAILFVVIPGPNEGDFLTRAELETSIIEEGQFGEGEEQLRVTDASCAAAGDGRRRYECVVDFRGGFRQSYTVTVTSDGNWVAR